MNCPSEKNSSVFEIVVLSKKNEEIEDSMKEPLVVLQGENGYQG